MHQLDSRLKHWICATTGAVIAGPPLNSLMRCQSADGLYYLKRRYWYAAVLIASATHSRARFRILQVAEWHVWERAVYRQVYNEDVRITVDGALVLPARPGRTLRDVLATDRSAGLAGVAAALRALEALHQQLIMLPGQPPRPFSHADATVANVTYQPGEGQAWWFDFETAHHRHFVHSWCCADDLRALLFSAVAVLGADSVAPLAQLVATVYTRSDVRYELRAIARSLLCQPDPWHLAQARLSYNLDRAMALALLHELD